jgi:hypothetical protein
MWARSHLRSRSHVPPSEASIFTSLDRELASTDCSRNMTRLFVISCNPHQSDSVAPAPHPSIRPCFPTSFSFPVTIAAAKPIMRVTMFEGASQ